MSTEDTSHTAPPVTEPDKKLMYSFFRDDALNDTTGTVYTNTIQFQGQQFFCKELPPATIADLKDWNGYIARELGITPEQVRDTDFMAGHPDLREKADALNTALYARVLDEALVDWDLPVPHSKELHAQLHLNAQYELSQRIIAASTTGVVDLDFLAGLSGR